MNDKTTYINPMRYFITKYPSKPLNYESCIIKTPKK